MHQIAMFNSFTKGRDTQCKRVIRVLADGKPKTSLDIIRGAGIVSPHTRLTDLRKFGFNITHAIRGPRYQWYTWMKEPMTDLEIASQISSAEKANY